MSETPRSGVVLFAKEILRVATLAAAGKKAATLNGGLKPKSVEFEARLSGL